MEPATAASRAARPYPHAWACLSPLAIRARPVMLSPMASPRPPVQTLGQIGDDVRS